MNNILAIAQKELRSYFASPIGYVVIGMFALLFGYFYYGTLSFFVQQGMQVSQFDFGGPAALNINQHVIRPMLNNSIMFTLFVLPMVTMRTYSEEKRSGTMELLLTSPLSDIQIVMGKFFGAMGLYVMMLAVTLLDIGLLFIYGNPEWPQVLVGYLGLLLLGGCFISVGLLISSTTKNQIVSGIVTFTVFLILWVITWLGDNASPLTQTILSYLSITEHFEDFSRGVLDTKHVVYYLSFTVFGLFLTLKSVDRERWKE